MKRAIMVPSTLRDGAGSFRAVAADASAIADGVMRLAALADLPPEVSGNLRDAARQLRRSAIAAERQAIFLSWRAHRGLLVEGPAGARGRTSLPQLLSPRLILREGDDGPAPALPVLPGTGTKRSQFEGGMTRATSHPVALADTEPVVTDGLADAVVAVTALATGAPTEEQTAAAVAATGDRHRLGAGPPAAAAVTDRSELVFSDAELTLVARIAGAPAFPATVAPGLEDAGWQAVTRGLVARGVVQEGPAGPVIAEDVDAVLGVVLFADRSLWATTASGEELGDVRGQVLCFAGETIVRHTLSEDGLRRFGVCDRAAADALPAAVLDMAPQPGARQADPTTDVDEEQLIADARLVTTVQSRIGDRRVAITIIDSPRHGLWLRRDESSVGSHLQPVSREAAHDEVTALVDATSDATPE